MFASSTVERNPIIATFGAYLGSAVVEDEFTLVGGLMVVGEGGADLDGGDGLISNELSLATPHLWLRAK